MERRLIPVKNCWVKKIGGNEAGKVVEIRRDFGPPRCRVRWLVSRNEELLAASELRSGFMIGMEVQDVPSSTARRTLGEGVVVEMRTLGGRDQVLVDFMERGEQHWLPFENLRQIRGVQERFVRNLAGEAGNAERFRLRNLAYAIEMWHENTGSLAQLDIDPLPHQIHLVHHILRSGNLNWLIVDDVGLGKTIEVGMLLSALIKKGTCKRILLVTPAGLVNQWKEELNSKFGLGEFQIYGDDFVINEVRHWKLHDHVIGSIDKLKSEDHLASLMQAEPWDIVVFDEAHRLSRSQYGMRYQAAERFRLAAALRRRTDSILLLTATPHQGKTDKFTALLEILRPELKNELRTLEMNYEILRDMVIRNKKSEVTDAAGNFIFIGKDTIQVAVEMNARGKDFDAALRKYIKEGYNVMAADDSMTGRAIGFVMTTYRKLASSSIAAIERSLRRRLAVLQESGEQLVRPASANGEDERFVGEQEETILYRDARPFFGGEIDLIEELIRKAQEVARADNKKHILMEKILPAILKENGEEKVVIFTEYRGTQDYLVEMLKERFGNDKVAVLHGSMNRLEREQEIGRFEDFGQFLVSTEAGGEGINLQRECHVMINFDLPWNPMRLVQRVGRLYRYGQKKKVIVFNMNVTESMDGNIIDILYKRIESVVNDMAVVGDEFRPGLEAEILGDLVEVLEVEDLLRQAGEKTTARTQECIDEALERARQAVQLQRDLMEYAAGYDREEASGEFRVGLEHVEAFVAGVMKELDIEVIETTHKGRAQRIRLPEALASELGMAGRQMHVTLDRDLAGRRHPIVMLDLNSRLLCYMLDYVKSYRFDGRVAALASLNGDAVMTGILRWQDDQGRRLRQEYGVVQITEEGGVETNSDEFSHWLKLPVVDGALQSLSGSLTKKLFAAGKKEMDKRLAEVSSMNLHPENLQVVTGGFIAK